MILTRIKNERAWNEASIHMTNLLRYKQKNNSDKRGIFFLSIEQT